MVGIDRRYLGLPETAKIFRLSTINENIEVGSAHIAKFRGQNPSRPKIFLFIFDKRNIPAVSCPPRYRTTDASTDAPIQSSALDPCIIKICDLRDRKVKCDLDNVGSTSSKSAIERLEPPEEVHGPIRPAWRGRRGPTARSRGCGVPRG